MKKILMRSVRAGLQLIPPSLKLKLKQSEKLTGLYVRSVRRAGLFYDAPTPKQTQTLYDAWLKLNKTASNGRANHHNGNWQALIFGEDKLEQTLTNLKEHGAQSCRSFTSLTRDNPEDLSTFLGASTPTLLVCAGDSINSEGVLGLLKALDEADIAYCDTDEIGGDGRRSSPRFLPDWNPDLQFSSAYVRTGVIVKSSILKRLTWREDTTIASLIVDLACADRTLTVAHLARTLINSRVSEEEEFNLLNSVKASLERHTNADTRVDKMKMINRVMWPSSNPLVSLIIPTKNAKSLVKACIESIIEKTIYDNYEILLIDNGSEEPDSLAYFDYLNSLEKVHVLKFPAPFNYSAINNFGVRHAKGSIIGLINNDIEVISPEWLNYMVGHAQRDDVGCVGAKLLYSDTRIQHAGVVLGYGGGAGHAHKNFPKSHSGYLSRIAATSNYSAVTAACLLVKKAHFDYVGGLNEHDLAVAFNDVDFCLRVKELGLNNVYCAEAELYHHESVSRGLDVSPEKAKRFNSELSYLQGKWQKYIAQDPCYSPNLTLKRENFSIKTLEEAESK